MRIAAQPVRMAPVQRSKYRAVKVTIDNITFASKAEAKRYGELKLLAKAGKITELRCQPVFSLWVYAGSRAPVTIGTYVADFEYLTLEGVPVIEDVKGFRTPLYRWKKKHVEAQYGIVVKEIR